MTERRLKYLYEHFMNVIQRLSILGHHGVIKIGYYLRAVGRKVLWSSACVCLCVCVSVRTVFVRKISQERVHGSPLNLVGGTRG